MVQIFSQIHPECVFSCMPSSFLKPSFFFLPLTVLHCPADNSSGRADIMHPVLRVFRQGKFAFFQTCV